MKICKALLLLGMFFASSECTSDILTTSHVEQAQPIGRRKNIKPKEHFCSENKIEKLVCRQKNSQACKSADPTSQDPVCGFDHFGVKFEFKRDCEACENENIKYYFKGTCDKTPQICTKTEECVNGLCVPMLNDAQDANRVVCNESQDCPTKSDLCIANKCVDKRQLVGKLQKAEQTHPELAKRTRKARKEAMKHEKERKIKDEEAIKQLKNEIRGLRQQNKLSLRYQKFLPNAVSPVASN